MKWELYEWIYNTYVLTNGVDILSTNMAQYLNANYDSYGFLLRFA